ncbi:MAG TPA: DNA methyltransferase [Candidatus Acidoferrales bacterium]|nr:DNA methyltransferase [Candidatus Acidoferrales bacterium]
MHKYFARRPWNVFSSLVAQYSSEGEIVLDPFFGGGATLVEALKIRRKAVGVDVNPVAKYVTSMECAPANLPQLASSFDELRARVEGELQALYQTRCSKCGSDAVADWLEWDEKTKRVLLVKLDCPHCRSIEKHADKRDQTLALQIEQDFGRRVKHGGLWFPRTKIPRGDKTDSLLARGLVSFDELFTRRNLLALAILRREILKAKSKAAREFLLFVFSSCLKWASRQSHLRGRIVEGWAMHAYWIYPKSLEMNVWKVFMRRYQAVFRGKKYSNEQIGPYCRFTDDFTELVRGDATCFLLNRDAADLPIPDATVDAVITDPPYGGNVNYAELSDFWYVWLSSGRTIDKKGEAVINRTQEKSIEEYQRHLESVFKECYRVLKRGSYFVSTFNSKDSRIVASFILAASVAGFTLLPDGVKYQAPIRPYATTFHAMQIGAFVGDFIFTFRKDSSQPKLSFDEAEWRRIQAEISQLVDEGVRSGRPEPNVREQAYALLIPFLAKYAVTSAAKCMSAANFFERKIRENDSYLKRTRKELTEKRRRMFSSS